MTFRAVIFDWRGTLVVTPTAVEWVADAFHRLGTNSSAREIDLTVEAIRRADGPECRLDAPGLDADSALHRGTFLEVFADAGLPDDLAFALYESESDFRHNRFAGDVEESLRALKASGIQIGVLSDIHFDIRPAFETEDLLASVDAFALSYELGVQKPDPAIFAAALDMLGVTAAETLMVGDRSKPDGGAVESGITTLLVPPLTHVSDRRLHYVLALCAPTEFRAA